MRIRKIQTFLAKYWKLIGFFVFVFLIFKSFPSTPAKKVIHEGPIPSIPEETETEQPTPTPGEPTPSEASLVRAIITHHSFNFDKLNTDYQKKHLDQFKYLHR